MKPFRNLIPYIRDPHKINLPPFHLLHLIQDTFLPPEGRKEKKG